MIPIFVLTCDRLASLYKSLASYSRYIGTPTEIIFIDFKSTYAPTIGYLLSYGAKVYWEGIANHASVLNRANDCIQDYFKTHPKSNYVLTDCDIALDNVRPDILEVYSFLLKTISGVTSVGPMLRIDDIPDCYPMKKKLISGGSHVEFHKRPIQQIKYKDRVIKYAHIPIDTTFAMYRAGSTWKRLTSGIRVMSPYSARHLDWYIDPANLSPDQAYYMNRAAKVITHWSNWERNKNG